jgi:hypothetical protein
MEYGQQQEVTLKMQLEYRLKSAKREVEKLENAIAFIENQPNAADFFEKVRELGLR